MNKNDFINSVAEKSNLTKKDTKVAIDALIQTLQDALTSGQSVSFIGFGAFTVTDRAARITKVPGTAQSVVVSASKVVKFKVGKKLKNLVSGKKHL